MCDSPSAPAVAVTVAATVAVACAPAMRMRAVRRQIDHVAMAHAALGDDVSCKLLHVGAAPLEYRDLHATFVVEMQSPSKTP